MVDFTVDEENDGEIVLEDSETAVFNTNETTPLISLKERRKQIVNDLYTDIKVPRWDDPEVFVRFKPVSATKFAATMERRRKSKSTDWTFLANVDMIVDSCVGVYCLIEGNERKFSLRLEDHMVNGLSLIPTWLRHLALKLSVPLTSARVFT